jgi:hypothetical protein
MDSRICIEATAEYHRRVKSRAVYEVFTYALSGIFVSFVAIVLVMILRGVWTDNRTTLAAGVVNGSMVAFVVNRLNAAAKEQAAAQRELVKACSHDDATKVIETVSLASLARRATMNVDSGPGNPDFS